MTLRRRGWLIESFSRPGVMVAGCVFRNHGSTAVPNAALSSSAPDEFEDRCALCRDLPLQFDSTTALGNYHGMLKRLVLELKRDMNESLAFQLGRLLGGRLMEKEFADQIDFLVPVPIHWSRRFKRGFHAAGVIAEGVKATTRLRIQSGIIKCQRLTRKQGTLTGPMRFSNVKHAFKLRPLTTVHGSSIVIIDDVMTSGATLSELARMLKREGASQVFGAVVARGTGNYKAMA